jgi:hypothetical protein
MYKAAKAGVQAKTRSDDRVKLSTYNAHEQLMTFYSLDMFVHVLAWCLGLELNPNESIRQDQHAPHQVHACATAVLSLQHPDTILRNPPRHPMEEEHDWQPFDFVLHR